MLARRYFRLIDLAQIVDTLYACETLFCLAGHTHVPCVVEYDHQSRRVLRVLTSASDLEDVAYSDEAATRRYLINPGSIGQPRDADPRASFALIDTERHRIAFRRVAYDIETTQHKIRQAGLPPFLADRLALGR
jgi:diadenosine tetraphosphatase ApaH/serine/threonine PP2A family protein phosphatase